MKRTTLEEIFDAVNHKATFFANMLRTQKLSIPYQNLKSVYIRQQQSSIQDYLYNMLNAYQKLAAGTEVNPRSIALLAACLSNYTDFKPFRELAGTGVASGMDLLTYLLSYDLHKVDKRATIVMGIPILMLDKLITFLRSLPEEHQRIRIMKLALGYRGAPEQVK